jgi:hypothetical protein
VSETSLPKPTVDEAKAAQARSLALRSVVRVIHALGPLSRTLRPILEDASLAMSFQVINVILDVAEARHTSLSSYLSRTQTEISCRTRRISTKPPKPHYTISASVQRRPGVRLNKLDIFDQRRRLKLLRGTFNLSAAVPMPMSTLEI